jgi:hypothetical protein
MEAPPLDPNPPPNEEDDKGERPNEADFIQLDDEDELSELTSIWGCPKIQKGHDEKSGKPKWTCLWCGETFLTWNATKAMMHVLRKSGQNVKVCRPGRIPLKYLKRYEALWERN